MKFLSLFYLFSLFLFFGYSNSQLYDFNLNTRVNINGQPHYKINYYPGSTDTNYKGDFYPDLETNTNLKKHLFTQSCTIDENTDYRANGLFTPNLNYNENPYFGYISDQNVVLIVPEGVTVTFLGQVHQIPTVLIKGRVVLYARGDAKYEVLKTIILPGGVFESVPTSPLNHTIKLSNFNPSTYPTWDPLRTSTFISLGGNVTIRALNTDSVWTGSNSSFTSYGGTFHKSFPFIGRAPVFKLSGTIGILNNIVYTMNSYYTDLTTPPSGSNKYADDLNFGGGGYIYMKPWSKNLWISGNGNTSMMFTGNSIVDIQNAVFSDIGHTNPSPLNDNTLDSNYNIVNYGSNPPDRYPITLLHNLFSVNIQNNMFIPLFTFNNPIPNSQTPRSYIGVKRSFGNIIGNAFVLQRSISGISLLHGTEQFSISLNAFISTYTDTTTVTTYRSYPDIDYLNGGIVTTSPFSTYDKNAFEGQFKGGAIQIIPIQNRSSVTGLSSDQLLGKYSSKTQDNTNNIKTNSIWNYNLVFKENFFAGETEFRVSYSLSSQPPLKFNLLGGWYIGQRASITLGSIGNQANIELIYDSPYIASSLSVNDESRVASSDTHNGRYNAVTIKNSIAIATYTFFSNTFRCDYLSITDSKFSHFSNTPDFIKKYTNQLYLHNVNGTKTNDYNGIINFFPIYSLSIIGSSNNDVLISFIPNLEYYQSEGQSVFYTINNQVVFFLEGLDLVDYLLLESFTKKSINLENGVNSILISSNQNSPTASSASGPYYAISYINDVSTSFYLGIDLTPDIQVTPRVLSIFNKQWTKCGWINSICTTTGILSKLTTIPTSISDSNGNTRTAIDEISMLTSYLTNNVANGVASSIRITLPASGSFKLFIYSLNPTFNEWDILNSLPQFTIKINGNYQEPYSRTTPKYQKYHIYGPFYWNSGTAPDNVTLIIEWASNNLNYAIPICGVEIYSNIVIPYVIPKN